VFIGMTLAFVAESHQGDWTQGLQSVVKPLESTGRVHSVWHSICVATETSGQIRSVLYYTVFLCKSYCKGEKDLQHHDTQILPQ
jgi:hypothetical protein